MKTNHKNIISLAITLQAFILLLAVITVPVTAIDDPVVPQLPIILYGNVDINGEPAPTGTLITAELNNEIIASTSVDYEGICGNCPANRLSIGCNADGLDNLKFYVGGAEAKVDMDIIKNANPGDVKELYFIATTASGDTSDGSRRSGGTSYRPLVSTTSDEGPDEAIPGTTSEKTSSSTTLESTRTDQPSESSEQIPAPEERSSTTTVGLIAVGGIVLVGAILAIKYGLKGS